MFCNVSKIVVCGKHNTLATFSEDASQFSWQAQHFGRVVIFRGTRSTLDVSCCVFFANRIVMAASSGDKVQVPWYAWYFVRCDENSWRPRTKHRFWGCKFSGSKENSFIYLLGNRQFLF